MTLFAKYHGGGNDFILIEDPKSRCLPLVTVTELCDRNRGIGADGMIFLQPSSLYDVKMVLFNRDGSRPKMCGNGLRCLALFAKDRGWINQDNIIVETDSGPFSVTFSQKGLTTEFPLPQLLHQDDHLTVLDSGVPHAVCLAPTLDPIEEEGKKIRYDARFAPDGVNATFITLFTHDTLLVRTYERGVEKVTQACGTGIIAASYVAHHYLHLSPYLSIHTQGQDLFHVHVTPTAIQLIGPASLVFTGSITRDEKN